MNMNEIEALNQLYNNVRQLPLKAEQHEFLKECVLKLAAFIENANKQKG